MKKPLTLFLPIETESDYYPVGLWKTYSKKPTIIKVKAIVKMEIRAKKERGWEIVKACPHCPSKLPEDKIEKALDERKYRTGLFNHIKLVQHLNNLTKRAKQEKISYTKYSKEWKKIQMIIERGDYVIYTRYLPELNNKFHLNCAEYPDIHQEKCNKCKRITRFDLFIEPDIELLPCLPKYIRRAKGVKPKEKCPKCGKLGIPHTDKRGYLKFYHYKDGKRIVCYIGKVAQ